jgi:hypothetical protein
MVIPAGRHGTRGRRWPVLVALVAVAWVTSPAAGSAAAEEEPYAIVLPALATTGQFVEVLGGGFRPQSLVVVELCGKPSDVLSAPCDPSTAVNVAADPAGRLTARLRVNPPGSGCPCAVRISSTTELVIAEAALSVDGVSGASGGLTQLAVSGAGQVEVVGVAIVTDDSWRSRFGGPNRPEVEFTVEHSGGQATRGITVVVAYGTDGQLDRQSQRVEVGPLGPGDRRSLRVPIDLGAMAWGPFEVQVSTVGSTPAPSDVVGASAYPWGLIVVVVLAMIEALLFTGRRLLRRHLADDPLRTRPDLALAVAAAALTVTEGDTGPPGGTNNGDLFADEVTTDGEPGSGRSDNPDADRLRLLAQRVLEEPEMGPVDDSLPAG